MLAALGLMPSCGALRRPLAEDREAGFTIIEILVAVCVLVIAILAVFTMLPAASTTIDHSKLKAQASSLAQQRIEELRNLPFDAASGTDLVGLHTTDPPLGNSPSETQAITVQGRSFTRRVWVNVTGSSPLREAAVTVAVDWSVRTGTHRVRLDALVGEK